MSNKVHQKIKDLITRDAVGTISVANCTLKYSNFVPKRSLDKEETFKKMNEELYSLLMAGPHPSLNPLMDAMSVEKKGTLKETLHHYIEKYSTTHTEDCDYTQDVMIVKVNVPLIMLNTLPFLDQDVIMIEKAVVQTPMFRYVLEE